MKKGPRKTKVHKVMREFKRRKLHSGSKRGPLVTKRSQGQAIALSEARKAGEDVPPRKNKKKGSTGKY